MSESFALERMLRHDRVVVLVSISVVVLLAWAYLLAGAGIDMSMAGMDMDPMPWSWTHAVVIFFMWWVMMIAMMVPSAAPTLLLFSTIKRKQEPLAKAAFHVWAFLAGYLTTWAAFSAGAVLLQWILETLGWISLEMASSSAVLGGTILVAGGLYQFTPIKAACLRFCQNPVIFLSRHWRPSPLGAFKLGVQHGVYCVGCCWFLMALLFVTGIMNLLWIIALALYVGTEKLVATNRRLSIGTGVALVGAGAAVLIRTLLFNSA